MKWFFWTLPIFVILAQALFTLNSFSQIRYEELADSVRNVFWLQKGLVYDGSSSSIGWYGILLVAYNLFGFALNSAKIVRLLLAAISIICLFLILKKYLGKNFWLPFLTIGLSPSLLFFNTLQTPHGIDFLFFPIVLYLINAGSWISALGWGLAMWAWISYPTFIFYLPALFIIYLWTKKYSFKNLIISLIAFVTPLVGMFIFIKNRTLLLIDPKLQSGLFRGAGSFDFSSDNFSHNLGGLIKDLFISGLSYHFEINQGEFSQVYPILSVVLVFVISWLLLFKFKKWRKLVMLILISQIGAVVVSSLTFDPSNAPGMRRYTPFLVDFYALFAISWKFLSSYKFKSKTIKWLCLGGVSLLLLHHLIVYPINLSHLSDVSPNAYPLWFVGSQTPQKSLDGLLETVQKENLKLVCLDEQSRPFYCRVSEVYAAVGGSCEWNHLDCHQILGFDFKSNQLIPLNVGLWDSYFFDH